jgi:hypothetical protein
MMLTTASSPVSMIWRLIISMDSMSRKTFVCNVTVSVRLC